MSWMLVRGKKFICNKCGKVTLVEYQGGALMTQIGDIEIMKQEHIAKELGENQNGENGYYLYDIGICENCYKTKINKSIQNRCERVDALLQELQENLELLEKTFYENLPKVRDIIKWNEMAKELEIDTDSLIDRRENKSKKRTPLKTYIHNNADKLTYYIVKKTFEIPEVENFTANYLNKKNAIISEIDKLFRKDSFFRFNNICYYFKDTTKAENLNSHFLADTTIRVPRDDSPSEKFYFEYEINIESIAGVYGISNRYFRLPRGFLRGTIEKAFEERES